MRSIEQTLRDRLAGPVTSLALCWRIQRRDGGIIALTAHDRDIVLDGLVYRASGGISASALRETGDLAVDNLALSGIISDDSLDPKDLAEGRFDGARVELFLLDWSDPGAGKLVLKSGDIGRTVFKDGLFEAEMRGLTQKLTRGIVETYSAGCRAELGDRRCKRSLLAFRRDGRVASVINARSFLADGLEESDNWYAFGRVTWHSGGNGGLESGIGESSPGQIILSEVPPNPIAVGDLFTIVAGCDKTRETCIGKFDNIANFRGEPFVPGIDRLIDYPGIR
ncbi:MAG: DUF2163 domain-containing protein [Rhodothalassiaceae bacterium]